MQGLSPPPVEYLWKTFLFGGHMAARPIVKPYFPMVLSNGADVVLVDYSGSMHCDSGHLHLEQHQDAHCGWQKSTHRERRRRLLTTAFFPYRVMGEDGEVFEPGPFEQRFDPRAATLVTEVQTHILHLRFTVFLATEPLYVERIQVLWIAPGAQPALALMGRQMADPAKAQVAFISGGPGQVAGEYALGEITGALRMAIRTDKPVRDHTKPDRGYLEVRELHPGDVIDRFITMQDTSHTEAPAKECERIIEKALAAGFDKLHEEHRRDWQGYHANTQVTLPDPAMDYQYRLGLYLMRASQHPTGFVTHGIYDVLWGGGAACAWDITFFMRAWLAANQRESAKMLSDYYQHGAAAPMAVEYAAQLGQPGRNYPWFFNVFGRDLFFPDAVAARDTQKWHLCCMILQLYDIYRFTGDAGDLRGRLPAMREMLAFLLAEIVACDGDRWYIRQIEGADENIDRVNDTAHLLTLVKALKDYLAACRVLDLPVEPRYAEAADRLGAALEENYRDGMLLPWQGASEINTESFAMACLNMPEGIGSKTLRAAYKMSHGEWGMTNAGQYPNLIWPWTESRAAVALSSIDPPLAFRRLVNAMRVTDTHGLFPEKVRPDGFWIFFGYGTPHATFVWALTSLLATDDGKRLTVATGLPAPWRDFSFAGVNTPSGFAVTCEMCDGKVEKLVIANPHPETREIRLRLLSRAHDAEARDETISLQPGENKIV